MNRALILPLCAVYFAAAGASACGPADETDAALVDALDAVFVTSFEGALLALARAGVKADMTADQAAQAAAEAAPKRFNRGLCQASASGATLTLKLFGCNDDADDAEHNRVTGTLKVIFAVSTDGIHARVTAEDIRTRRATFDINAEAVGSFEDGVTTLSVLTNAEGTGPLGRPIAREGAYTLEVDDAPEGGFGRCVALDGVWSTVARGRSLRTSVRSFKRCDGRCPAAGGEIEIEDEVSGESLTITYTGEASASWKSSQGESGSKQLDCAL
jgi:hypothetical protein